MGVFHMSLEKSEGGKPYFPWIASVVLLGSALITPKAVLSVIPLLMSPQATGGVEPLPADGTRLVRFVATLECSFVLMLGPDVALEGLVLAEALVTGREIATSESLLALVN